MTTKGRQPKLDLIDQGEEFKVFSVTANAGDMMAKHISTKEATVYFEEGSGTLFLEEGEFDLNQGDLFIIPAGNVHSLKVKSDVKALITMAVDSEIKFK